MTDIQTLSESELRALINKAESVLKNKEANKKKEVIAKIRELAASIDANVEITENVKKNDRKASKVPIKYRHPKDPEKVWTGRGMTPKWMQELVNKGHDRSEFEV